MKSLFWKMALVIGALVLTAPIERALADPLKVPEPDPGLLAAVDIQANTLQEGVAMGDFETWYPGLYPGYRWAREITEIGSNGLFRVDYAVFHARDRHRAAARELSLLLFRPESPPGSASGGVAPPVPAADSRAARPCRPAARATASSLAARLIEDALVTAQFFAANARYYLFFGDSQSLSLVSRLPDSFPGAESLGGAEVRRVSFHLQPGRQGGSDLVVEHAPLLVDTGQVEPYRAMLAEGVSVLHLQYWDTQAAEWTQQWNSTNSMPRMVQVTLGLGKPHGRASVPHELVSRIVALPARTVTGDIQGTGSPFPPTFPTNSPPRPPRNPPPSRGLAPVPEAPAVEAAVSDHVTELGHQVPRTTLLAPPNHDRTHDLELEWLGRSAVEYATYILGQGSVGIAGIYDALNQKWAGGTGDTNSGVSELPMENVPLGNGRFSLEILDLDRKVNINMAAMREDRMILQGALMKIVGPEGQDTSSIVDAILDWCDRDSDTQLSGAEDADYMSNPNFGFPPYEAKDGPIDDITELLLIRGVTPAIFWGNSGDNYATALPRALPARRSHFEEPVYLVGLVDLFTPLSSRLLNINTASTDALQVLPAIDENVAQAIRMARAGPDGVEGNEDDAPFLNPNEIAYRVPGFHPIIAHQLARFFTVRSLVFETHVLVELGGNRREYVALLRRNNPRDVQVLTFYWKQLPAPQESDGR